MNGLGAWACVCVVFVENRIVLYVPNTPNTVHSIVVSLLHMYVGYACVCLRLRVYLYNILRQER